MTNHVKSKRHAEMASACATASSITSHFNPQVNDMVIEAEVRWATFMAKHILAFLASDHANKLFRTMFSDSEVAKKFLCARTKTTAIVKQSILHGESCF